MSDNKISSISKYSVSSVSKISTNTSITKRPYDNSSFSSNKEGTNSRSFKKTLKSSASKESQKDDDKDFSNLLSNQLNDKSILNSRETSRVVRAKFISATPLTKTNSEAKDISQEVNTKLRDAMKVEVDTSELYKKLQKLHSLK